MAELNYRRLFYTACIFINHFAFGILSNVMWPSLVDLRYIYHTSIETISYLSVFSRIGYLLGSLFGLLYRWLNRQLTLALLCIIMALLMALVPLYGHLWLFYLGIAGLGWGGGAWDSSNNVWLVDMWAEKNAPIIQSSQFMYGFGNILGALIVSPYVHGEDNSTASGEVWSADQRKHLLTLPFSIVGLSQAFIPLVLLVAFFFYRYKNDQVGKPEDQELKPGLSDEKAVEQLKPRITNRKLKLAVVALCLATYDAAERGYFVNAPTAFQYMDIKLEASASAHMSSILSAAYTFGRLFSAFVTLKVAPDVIIMYHFVIIACAQVFIFFVRHNQTLIFVGTGFLGFGFSAMWPATLAFTETHLRLTNKVGTLLFFCTSGACLFTPFILGRFLESQPLALFLFQLVNLAVSMALYAIVKFVLLPFW